MTPERAAGLVRWWVRRYTRDLPDAVAERRVGELDADLHDHVDHARGQGASDGAVALGVLSRALRGVAADAAWRDDQVRAHLDHPPTLRAARRTRRRAYGSGLALALLAQLFLFWVIGALGLIGDSGDRMDMLYLGVFGVGLLGALAVRLRPRGMARVLVAMALVQTAIVAAALVAGKHRDPVTSIPELVGLNAIFVALFLAAAWLFARAARHRHAGRRS